MLGHGGVLPALHAVFSAAVTQEDVGGLHRGVLLHHRIWHYGKKGFQHSDPHHIVMC